MTLNMARQEYIYEELTTTAAKTKVRPRDTWMRQGWFRLLALLMALEVFLPFLIWPIGFPRVIIGGIEVGIALIILVAFAYMMVQDRIPGAILLITAISLVWGLLPTLEGQQLVATAWGWWGIFKYPLLAIFAYLVQGWPTDFARWFIRFSIALLIFQICIQLVMYALGFPTGDSMGGTFGQKGVMQFSMLTFFVVTLGLGHWLATHKWKLLVGVLALGLLGTTLSGTKFYLIAVAALALVTLIVHMIRGGQFKQLFLYIVLIGAVGAIFVPVYNSYLVNNAGLRPLQEYLQPDVLESYLFNDGISSDDTSFNIGRGLAIIYSWQQVQRDWTTRLFGFGLGTRSQSTFLGVRGNVLQEDPYGVGITTMGTWIQEFGIIGLALFLIICLWIALKLFRFANASEDPYQATLAYGLLLFTMFWPLWLWYHKAWLAGAMMTLYWVSLGYTFRLINRPSRRAAAARRGAGKRR